jgi:hypothetical protein
MLKAPKCFSTLISRIHVISIQNKLDQVRHRARVGGKRVDAVEPLGEDIAVGNRRGERREAGLPMPSGARLKLSVLGDLLSHGALQVGDLVARHGGGQTGAAAHKGDAAVGAYAGGNAGSGFIKSVVCVGRVNPVQRHTPGGRVSQCTWEQCKKSHEKGRGHHDGEDGCWTSRWCPLA